MFSTPQNYHKSILRLNFGTIPPPFDMKNMPHPTPPPELLENPKMIFKSYNKNGKNIIARIR